MFSTAKCLRRLIYVGDIFYRTVPIPQWCSLDQTLFKIHDHLWLICCICPQHGIGIPRALIYILACLNLIWRNVRYHCCPDWQLWGRALPGNIYFRFPEMLSPWFWLSTNFKRLYCHSAHLIGRGSHDVLSHSMLYTNWMEASNWCTINSSCRLAITSTGFGLEHWLVVREMSATIFLWNDVYVKGALWCYFGNFIKSQKVSSHQWIKKLWSSFVI